jgi:hypothetical protein
MLAGACVLQAADGGRAGGPNLLPNGDFEAGRNAWALAPDVHALQAEGGQEGSACLRLRNHDPKRYRLASQVVTVEPGRTYRLRVWIKTKDVEPGENGGGATASLEWGSKTGWIGGIWDNGYIGTGNWQLLELTGTAPKTATRAWVHLYLTKRAVGEAWFDEVELCELAPLDLAPVLLHPHYRGILWPDETDRMIRLKVALDRLFFGAPAKTTLYLEAQLNDGKATRIGPVEPGSKVLALDASALKTGPWRAMLRLMEPGVDQPRAVGQLNGQIWPRDRPRPRVWIDRHKRSIVDGKPFLPIGIYLGGLGPAELDPLADSGFNTILPYAFLEPAKGAKDPAAEIRRVLDDAEERKLKVVVNLLETFSQAKGYLSQGLGGIRGETEMVELVTGVCRDHPAVLAYYLNDEYLVATVPYFRERYEQVRALDPEHPAFVCLNVPEQLSHYVATTDILGVDPYPIGPGLKGKPGPVRLVIEWTRAAAAVTAERGPVWVVPQAFNWGLYRGKEALRTSRAPTEQETRCMTFLALAEGASGLVYYSMFDLLRDPVGFDRRWREVRAVVAELRRIEAALLSLQPPPAVTVKGGDAADVRWRAMALSADTVCLLVANAALAERRISLRLPGPVHSVELISGTGPQHQGETLDFTLPVHGVTICELRLGRSPAP